MIISLSSSTTRPWDGFMSPRELPSRLRLMAPALGRPRLPGLEPEGKCGPPVSPKMQR